MTSLRHFNYYFLFLADHVVDTLPQMWRQAADITANKKFPHIPHILLVTSKSQIWKVFFFPSRQFLFTAHLIWLKAASDYLNWILTHQLTLIKETFLIFYSMFRFQAADDHCVGCKQCGYYSVEYDMFWEVVFVFCKRASDSVPVKQIQELSSKIWNRINQQKPRKQGRRLKNEQNDPLELNTV